MDQTCALLNSLGITETAPFRENGVTGGDLLELSEEEMRESLKLSPLQVGPHAAGQLPSIWKRWSCWQAAAMNLLTDCPEMLLILACSKTVLRALHEYQLLISAGEEAKTSNPGF